MAFTYDISTPRGKVRYFARDKTATNYIHEDAELDALLELNGQNVYLAAAEAFESVIRDRGLLAKTVTREGFSSTQHAIAELQALATGLRSRAISAGGLQTSDIEISPDTLEYEKPSWFTEDGDAV